MRKIELISGEYYHIYNRGVEKRNIFVDFADYERFISSLKDFNSTEPAWKIEWAKEKGEIIKGEPLIDIVAYCLNPNHFHLLLKQIRNNGITNYMRKLGIGHTMYFNKRYERSGFLFQGKFKSAHIPLNNYLLYLSVYINCNSEVHGISKADRYRWSSFREYLSGDNILCNKNVILDQFINLKDYREFMRENLVAIKEKKAEDEDIKKLLLE